MVYKLISLDKENDLNKILKKQKFTNEDIHFLFYSLWDKHSASLVEKLKDKLGSSKKKNGPPLYLVDSFNMPHSFVIFNTSKVPSLVSLERGKIVVEDYLSKIYEKFNI